MEERSGQVGRLLDLNAINEYVHKTQYIHTAGSILFLLWAMFKINETSFVATWEWYMVLV